jgi:hypothetical protein
LKKDKKQVMSTFLLLLCPCFDGKQTSFISVFLLKQQQHQKIAQQNLKGDKDSFQLKLRFLLLIPYPIYLP